MKSEEHKNANFPDTSVYQADLNKAMNVSEVSSLFEYLDIVIRRWWIILLFILFAFAISFYYTTKLQKNYIYTFTIVYQGKEKATNFSGLDMLNNKDFDKNLWLNVMKSRLIMQSISDVMTIKHTPETLLNMIRVEQKRDIDNIFNITITSPELSLLYPFAHGFVDALNKYERRIVSSNTDSLIYVLAIQNSDIDLELTSINGAIKDYFIQNNILEAKDLENKLNQLNQYKSDLTSSIVELNAIRASQVAIETKLGVKEADIDALMTNIDPLRTRLMNLQVELATNQTKYSDKHPKIVSIKRNIQNIMDLMAQGITPSDSLEDYSTNRMQQNLTQQLINLNVREIEYETRIASWEKVIEELNSVVTNMIYHDDRLQELLKRKQLLEHSSIDIQKNKLDAQTSNIMHIDHFIMLDEPKLPALPSSKNNNKFVIIGIICGLGMGLFFSIVYEKFTGKIYSTDRLQNIAKCPIIASIPLLKVSLNSVLASEMETKEYLLPFTILKVKVKVLYVKNKCNYITIVSPERLEGKSTICISLALALANDGYKVLLVDSDLWSPSLTKTFDLLNKPGVSDFLKDHQKSVEKIIYSTHIKNLSVLPAGTELDNIGNILRPETINELQSEVRHMFDWVITDTPALLLVPDSYEFIKFSPTILMVISLAQTTMVDFKEMIMHINMAQIHLTGIIVNRVKSSIISKYYQPTYTFRYGYYNKYHQTSDKFAKTHKIDESNKQGDSSL